MFEDLETVSCVLVCGGRQYTDWMKEYHVLDELYNRTSFGTLIHGGASGADAIAVEWAVSSMVRRDRFNVLVRPFPADWKTHGKAAGPKRNQRMLDEGKPDLVIAFPGGRGTADMVRRARKAGIPVQEVK